MKPTLLSLPGPGWPVALAIIVLEIVIAALWLMQLRKRGINTQDYLYTAIALVGMTAVVLAILMKIGRVEIKSYGAMLMFGFLAGTFAATRLGKRRAIPGERLIDLGLVILVGAILGARLGYVMQNPGEVFFNFRSVMSQGLGGLSFHGGLIGGFLTGSIYLWIMRLNFWRVTDAVAPAIAIGYAITRIGCFLNGCCLGVQANVPWAMVFPETPEAELRHIAVHPTQLYASAMGLVMFVILLLLSRGRSLGRAGRLFMAFLMLESVERFVMEIYRFPAHQGLSAAQIVSIVLLILGVVGWFTLPKRTAVDEAQLAAVPVKK